MRSTARIIMVERIIRRARAGVLCVCLLSVHVLLYTIYTLDTVCPIYTGDI